MSDEETEKKGLKEEELKENIRKDGYEGEPPENAKPPFPEDVKPQDSSDSQETQDE